MANPAPGVSINVSASTSNNKTNASTGTWFVLGTAQGPAGVAVPINSMADFNKYFGQTVNGQITGRYTVTPGSVTIDSTLLYDSLDVFFREGGINAYVSRVVSSTAVTAKSPTASGKFLLTAQGAGTWANSASGSTNGLILTLTSFTANSTVVATATITYNGQTLAVSPTLGNDTDVINWVNSLPAYQSMCVASAQSGTTIFPTTTAQTVNVYLTGGTDVATADADSVAALAVFTDVYGPGNISFPGSTSGTVYANLTNHAATFNRVAILDGANTATASTLISAVTTLQAAVTDPSYAGIFAPWLTIPGIGATSASQTSGFVFSRTVPPSGFVAAQCATNDTQNDANVPAAGINNGNLVYATNVTQTWPATSTTGNDRQTLNNAGVNVIRLVPNTGTICIYGFRSTAVDPNWVYLNNVRFRMQVIKDLDIVAEGFVFNEIDGKGHIFAKLNGAIAGVCQGYWTRGSIYGDTPTNAFSVNTGTQINTPTTIAAGQINAAVNLRMSPFGEYVTVNVTKYSVASALPTF